MPLRPLLLTGGPAVGKTTCGRALAEERPRAAYLDGDDVRQLVVAGAATLWSGPAGEDQLLLAVRNCAAVARNLLEAGFAVVIADYVTPRSLAVYRDLLPWCLVVHLQISLPAARERAATRPVHLTDEEFDLLHAMITDPPQADVVLDVDRLSRDEQVAAIRAVWLDQSA